MNDLRELANNEGLIELARRAVEDALVDLRESRVSLPFRNNGLVCKERDGDDSSTIRLGLEDGVRIGLRAIADALDRQRTCLHTGEWMYRSNRQRQIERMWCMECGCRSSVSGFVKS